jgi:hypothetical protein
MDLRVNGKIKERNRFFMALFFLLFFPVFMGASISVSPTLFELKIPRGKSYTDAVRVVNVGKAATRVSVYLSDFDLKKDGGVLFFEAGTHRYSLARHLRLNPTSFVLEAGEEKWVRFTVTLPADSKGESRGILFFQTLPKEVKRTPGKQVLVSARIGAAVYAAVKPTIVYSSEISDLFLKQDPEDDSLHYALLYHNNGNIHLRPKGELKVLDPAGKEVASISVNEKNTSILRDSYRIFTGTFKRNVKSGDGVHKVVVSVDYGKAVLEAEKSIYLLNEGGIEAFEAKPGYRRPGKDNQALSIVFSAKTRGIEPGKASKKSSFRIKTMDGRLLAEIPAKLAHTRTGTKKKTPSPLTVNFKGQWSGQLKPGIYFAEFLIFLHENKPLTSYCQITLRGGD